MLEQIEQILDEKVRPQLALHGGDIRSLSCEDGVYRFRLLGQCSNCPSSTITTQNVIEEALRQELPQIQKVVLDQPVSEELLEMARKILGHEL